MRHHGWLIGLIGLITTSVEAQPLHRINSDTTAWRPAAVVVDDCQLVHTTQILPVSADGGAAAHSSDEQLDHLLTQLDKVIAACETSRDRVVKLNFYVSDTAVRDLVSSKLIDWFGRNSLPAVSFVATALPDTETKVALDAVIAADPNTDAQRPTFGKFEAQRRQADWCIMSRGDVVYVSGQAQEPGELANATRATLDSLLRTLRHMKLDRQHIVGLKCFLQPMSQVDIVDREIARCFGEGTIPPVSHVQWRGGDGSIEIELIAYAPPVETEESVSYKTPPWLNASPVFSRVARVHGDQRIYVSGLYATSDGDGEAQVRDIFRTLETTLAAAGSDMRHLAKATYYVSDDDASQQLNAIRPLIYDPKQPPAASKARVTSVAAERRSITLDMIAAPAASQAGDQRAQAADWQAGVAKVVITPEKPVWLAGYGNKRPPSGKLHDLWMKALALEDPKGQRVVLITSDFQGVPKMMSDRVFEHLQAKFQLQRRQVMFTFSHNHCGPRLGDDLVDYYPVEEQQVELVKEYTDLMVTKSVELVGEALSRLSPASLRIGEGETTFAVNRRNNPEADVPDMLAKGIPLKGPVDHTVPVMTVTRPDGKLEAVVFGYACHPTTLSFLMWCGDYPGYAQLELEQSHPGVTAMFVNTCGGDQNPLPRRKVELCERYGTMLATAVEQVLAQPLKPVSPSLHTAFELVELPYVNVVGREELVGLLQDENAIRARWAARMLRKLESGESFESAYPYPIHAWQLGSEMLVIGMGAETVVDYALRFKGEFGPGTWVCGYADDMISYIPSRRVWEEGGYEGGSRLYEYGRPAFRWSGDIEDRIAATVHKLVKQVREQ